MSQRVVHFEIHADDPTRAMHFYKEVFGWEFEQWGTEEYWMIRTAPKESTEPGINGGLMKRKGPPPVEGGPVNGFVCTMQVESIDTTIQNIEALGGRVAVPKFSFPGMAWQAYYKDTEGNIIGIHQADPNAK